MTKEEFLQDRKSEYLYGTPSIVNKTKHQYRMLKIGFAIFIIIAATIIGAIFLTLVEQREENKHQTKIIKDLKYDNVNLQNTISSKNQLVRNYQDEAKRLKKQIRNIKYSRSSNYTKKEVQNNYVQNKKYVKPKVQQKTQRKKSNHKRYQHFSKNIQLVSDSKITKDKYNRLNSSRPIYGRYFPSPYSFQNGISNIKYNGLNI